MARALFKDKSDRPFRQKSNFVFPKNFTPYWALKDVKSFSIIEKFFARVKQVLLSPVSIQGCKKLSEYNHSTQTLSSNSSHVAGISQVMKHIKINRPQMVSITKLYLTLRKKLFFVSVVLPIEKARSHHMTLGITEVNTNGFHEFYALFSPRNKFKTSILTSQLKQMSCSKNDEEKKTPDLRFGNVFQLPSRRSSRRWSRSGTNLVIFLGALCAQTNLFWREMRINKMYTEI